VAAPDQETEALAGLEIVLFGSAQEWEAWLGDHHARQQGLWLKLAKKGAAVATVSYAEALDVALCYGWIDGQKQGYDGAFWLQKFTPRRAKSIWSKTNTEHVARLTAAGRMQPGGLREVEAARRDGRWEAAYAAQGAQNVPADLQAALDAHPRAREAFAGLTKAARFALCFRVESARRPETRRARIEAGIAALEEQR
jgi:uncharacterized protein YdeI (YjbR/CyaY-like superfamily)